ncbi:hypothetical protein ACWELJ_21345 [Nocardia sp. NPDC004582]
MGLSNVDIHFDTGQLVRLVPVTLIGAWRGYQSILRPTFTSVLVTIAMAATAANVVIEALIIALGRQRGAHPFLWGPVQVAMLMIVWSCICTYYAHAEASRAAWRVVAGVVTLSLVDLAVLIWVARAVPAGAAFYDFHRPEVVRYHVLIQLAFFPLACMAACWLAARAARAATGPLRFAMWMAAVSQAILTAASPLRVLTILLIQEGTSPRSDSVHLILKLSAVCFYGGATLFVASFGAVALAHRTKQLQGLRRALRDNRRLRPLLAALEEISPANLTYPRSGRTPLLLRPHAALTTTSTEIRDRLLTMSPWLGDLLSAEGHDDPAEIAKVIAEVRDTGIGLVDADDDARPAVQLLAVERSDLDNLLDLADQLHAHTRP